MDNPGFSGNNETELHQRGSQSDSMVSKHSKEHVPIDELDVKHDDDNSSGSFRLKRRMGLLSGVALIVGTMIGSGIFVSPKGVLARTRSPGLCLVIWAACGVLSMLGALAYGELGTLIPRSGAEYAYYLEAYGPLHKFFGPIMAFLFAWVTILLLKPSSLAILSLSFAKYLAQPIFRAIGMCPDEYLDFVVNRLLAALCIGLVTFVNCFSVTLATRVQNVFTIAKLTALAIIIGGGIYELCIGNTKNLQQGFEGSTQSFGEIAGAFYSGLWSYDGWNNLNYVTEELKNPYVNLPRAIIIGIPLTAAFYIMVNVAYFSVLSVEEILASDAVAVSFAEKVLGPAGFLVPLGVVMSVFGTANGSVFTAGRLSHVAGKEGHVIDLLSYVHIRRITPAPPILLNSFLALIMIIPGDIGSLIDFFSFTAWIFYGASMVALILMRFTRKNDTRPYKVPIIIPIIVLIVSVYLVIGPIVDDPQIQYLYALIFILAGLIFYVPFVYYKKVLPGMGYFTRFFQKLLEVAPAAN